MRAILILIVIGLLMAMAGWLTISRNGSQTSITIENQKIERDTERAIHRGADIIHHPQQGQPMIDVGPRETIVVPAPAP